jgi:hypothetical protein
LQESCNGIKAAAVQRDAANVVAKPIRNERKKKMRKIITAATLTLALSCFAYAGEMQTGSAPPTTKGDTQNGNMPNEVAGEIPNDSTDASSQTSTFYTLEGLETSFTLIQNVLGLF